MRVIMHHKKWWHRFIPSKRKNLKMMQAIANFYLSKPEVEAEILRKTRNKIIYGNEEGL